MVLHIWTWYFGAHTHPSHDAYRICPHARNMGTVKIWHKPEYMVESYRISSCSASYFCILFPATHSGGEISLLRKHAQLLLA